MATIVDQLNQFIADSLGKCLDYDGYAGCQCMDICLYWAQYLDLPLLAAPSALDTWDLNPDPTKWQKIPCQPGVLPQPGDMTVWGSYMGQWGHIDIVVDQISDSGFRGIDQNWFNSNETVGSPAAFVFHSYAGVLGWYRPVLAVAPASVPHPISSTDA